MWGNWIKRLGRFESTGENFPAPFPTTLFWHSSASKRMEGCTAHVPDLLDRSGAESCRLPSHVDWEPHPAHRLFAIDPCKASNTTELAV